MAESLKGNGLTTGSSQFELSIEMMKDAWPWAFHLGGQSLEK